MNKISRLFLSLVLMLSVFVASPHQSVFADNVDVGFDPTSEWHTRDGYEGEINEKIVDGKRYVQLKSTPKNNNDDKPAIFNKVGGWKVGADGSATSSLKFIPQNDPKDGRVALGLMFSSPDSALRIGYDAGGWFWQLNNQSKVDWYQGGRVPAPAKGEAVEVEFKLKDNQLNAKIITEGSETALFDPLMLDAKDISDLLGKSQDIVIRLATFGSAMSEILILANDQNDIPVVKPEVEESPREVIGRYDDYSKVYDFEDGNADIFEPKYGDFTTEIVGDADKKLKVNFSKQNFNFAILKSIPLLEDYTLEADITLNDAVTNRLGFVGRMHDMETFAQIISGDKESTYFTEYYGKETQWSPDATGPKLEQGKTYKFKAEVKGSVLKLYIDNVLIMENDMSGVPEGDSRLGFMKHRGATSITLDNIKLDRIVPVKPTDPNNDNADLTEIVTPELKVVIDKAFPRVVSYTHTQSGKQMHGQAQALDTIRINGIDVKPSVAFKLVSGARAEYIMDVKDDANNINATLYAYLTVTKNTLAFDIRKIENHNSDQSSNDKIIRTIEIPNHSLISVHTDTPNATLMGSRLSVNTTVSGDEEIKVADIEGKHGKNYMYAFVSDDNLSAGIYSNSQFNLGGGAQDFVRVRSDLTRYLSYDSMGLSSSPWIFHRDVKYNEDTLDYPHAAVAITDDTNNDQKVDWQDGAIAYRDIMQKRKGGEDVPDYVGYRVAMNFNSHAANPFLMTLDGIKKVNLHTDGLGQSVLLKGYGSEGHDSGHLNYADINRGAGGVEEFKYLLQESRQYGAGLGIHVNASETYPESKYFSEDILRKDANGNYAYGWNWLDQGINIDASYDLANGRRQRFEDLREVIGGDDNNLDFIYIDVWGNGQSGDNAAWASHQLAKEVMDQGWRVAGEWGYAFEHDSTFQHWSADLTYGGYKLKGINSKVARFISNHERDSWNAHYPEYSGGSEYPLLGGYDMKDFEGWQGRNDYAGYITNLFENNVSTKFLQHYKVSNWVDGATQTMPHPEYSNQTIQWTPEKRVELMSDDGKDKVVIERKTEDYRDLQNFRSRTITLNDRKILDGSSYLIPWFWDANGNPLEASDEKMYHFNKEGGSTTWTLPQDWIGTDVKMYTLTETGRKEVSDFSVNGSEITLEAKASQPYVLYHTQPKAVEVTYGVGSHLLDPGFNRQDLKVWDVTGEGAEVVRSEASNDMLRIQDNTDVTEVSQVLTDLEAGKSYAVYVGVDNRSDAKASLILDINGETKEVYTEQSIAKNFIMSYAHNDNAGTVDGSSNFQNMFLNFVAPESGDVRLTLRKDAGSGSAYFDDPRVTLNEGKYGFENGVFEHDFENNAQGIYPFVIGNVEGVYDNRTHLSELHEPYTQRGWNGKKVDDVISGNWSVKTNGLVGRQKLVYQTIPQNIRFEENHKYTISFDYEMGSTNTYALVIGDGPYTGKEQRIELPSTIDLEGPQTYTFEIEGSPSEQMWFGIYSTDVGADTRGDSGGNADFRGYKDFILDNLKVVDHDYEEELTIEASKPLDATIAEAQKIDASKYTAESYAAFKTVLDEAIELVKAFKAQFETAQPFAFFAAKADAVADQKITVADLKAMDTRLQEAMKQLVVKEETETPGEGNETPGEGNETPGEGNETPGEGNETPGEGNETPGEGTETPGEGNETPGEGNETPGEGTETPGEGTETPGEGNETPNGETETPIVETEDNVDEGGVLPQAGQGNTLVWVGFSMLLLGAVALVLKRKKA